MIKEKQAESTNNNDISCHMNTIVVRKFDRLLSIVLKFHRNIGKQENNFLGRNRYSSLVINFNIWSVIFWHAMFNIYR